MAVTRKFNHSLDTVWALMCNADFRVERSQAVGEHSADCGVQQTDDSVKVVMNRVVSREPPSVLKKIFSPKQTLAFTENWTASADGWRGTMQIEIKGQPVTISADMSLTGDDSGCVYTVEHRCKAKIPLVGGKVEKFVLSQTDDGAAEELDYLEKRLSS